MWRVLAFVMERRAGRDVVAPAVNSATTSGVRLRRLEAAIAARASSSRRSWATSSTLAYSDDNDAVRENDVSSKLSRVARRRLALWTPIWTLMGPVSFVSCVSWKHSVNAAETHETFHWDSGMRYHPFGQVPIRAQIEPISAGSANSSTLISTLMRWRRSPQG